MKFRKITLFSTVMISLFVLSACGLLDAEDIAGEIADEVLTIAAATIQAELTQNAADTEGTSEADSDTEGDSESETAAVADATATSIPEGAPPPAATQTPGTVGCTDVASFVADLTVPDGMEFAPNAGFTKTWRLENAGTCTWTSGYQIIFDSGDAMGGPAAQQLTGGTVAPGGTVDVSIPQTAPGSAGTYRGNYRLRNGSGIIFSLSNGNPFYLEIAVVEPGGPIIVLPLFPTATPTFSIVLIPGIITLLNANFDAFYSGTHACNGTTLVYFKITNTGGVALESLKLRIQTSGGAALNGLGGTQNKPFHALPPESYPQCIQEGADTLATSSSRWVRASIPSGTPGKGIIKLCGLDNLEGFCKEVTVNF